MAGPGGPLRGHCRPGTSAACRAPAPDCSGRGAVAGEWQGPHRAGQFGKVLARELDHIPHAQDGAEGGLVRVEAAGLHVGGRQVGEQVSPRRTGVR